MEATPLWVKNRFLKIASVLRAHSLFIALTVQPNVLKRVGSCDWVLYLDCAVLHKGLEHGGVWHPNGFRNILETYQRLPMPGHTGCHLAFLSPVFNMGD